MSENAPHAAIESAITDSKAALATSPDKQAQQAHYTDAVQHDTPQQSLDNDRLTGDGAEGEKQQQQTVTIPAPQTDSGRPETRHIPTRPATTSESGTTLHDAIKGEQAQVAARKAPDYKRVDFGQAGSLAIESLGQKHYGVSGAELDVTVRVSETETFTLRGVHERFLKE